MSACSSTVGSSLRSRKHSSVRNRPTPSTGAVGRRRRPTAPSATLASSLTGMPSAVAAGAGPPRQRLAVLAAWRRLASRASRRPGSTSTSPVAPSTSTGCRRAARSQPATPTTQGMPSWRAMIAVWLVGPPFSVTSATTSGGSSPAVSAGREVLGDAAPTARRAWGRPGSGSPTRWAVTRLADVAQVGDPLGHQRRPSARTCRRTARRAACTASSSASPAEPLLAHRGAQPLVLARPAVAVEHLGGGAGWRWAARAAEPFGDGRRPPRRTPRVRPRRRSVRTRRPRSPPGRYRERARTTARRRRPGTTGVPRSGEGVVVGAVRLWPWPQ